MAATANGWPQLTKFSARFTAPTGASCTVASKDLAILFAYVAWRMDTEVAHLTSAYGGRTIAQQIEVYRQQGISNPDLSSNHISGTACDFAKAGVVYERFQSGKYRSGYTAAQEARIRAICAATGVMQWGGDFRAGFRDPVHVQVRENLSVHGQRVVSAAALAAAAKKIGTWAKGVQKVVGVTADGIPGPATIKAVRTWQAAKELTVDGIWGPECEKAAGKTTPAPPAKSPPKSPAKPATQLAGVDVSSFQTIAQWKAHSPKFVLVKAHEGLSWHDPAYAAHRAAVRGAGLLLGAYTYAWPEYDAVACCTDFLATAGLRSGEVGVMDFEPYKSTSSPATWPAWLIRWGTEYRRRTGVWPWLYANDDKLGQLAQHATTAQMNVLRQWPLWKAAYASTPGALHGWPSLTCWQHSETGIDQDIFYGDAATFRRLGIGGATTQPVKEEGDDMPDAAPTHSWSGKRALKKGWNSVQVDKFSTGKPQYTIETGPVTGTSDLYVAVDGLPPGQTIQIRAVEYAQKSGKWTKVASYGVSEHQTTSGSTFAHRSQVIKVAKGRRLSWEIYVPQACHQLSGVARDLIWKKVIS